MGLSLGHVTNMDVEELDDGHGTRVDADESHEAAEPTYTGGAHVPERESDIDVEAHPNNNDEERIEDEPGFCDCGTLKAVCCRALICYSLVFLLTAIVLVSALSVSIDWYQSDIDDFEQQTYCNQTVLITLDSHIQSVSLQAHTEHNIQSYTLGAILLPCVELTPTLTVNVHKNDHPKFFHRNDRLWYLLKDSVIYVQYNQTSQDVKEATIIWIFHDQSVLRKANIYKPQCSDTYYQKYGVCTNFTGNGTFNYTIPFNSFYFMLCLEEGTHYCSPDWTMDVYWYNFELFVNQSNVKPENIQPTSKTSLTIRDSFDPFHFWSEQSQCILVHSPNTEDLCDELIANVMVSDINKVSDVWFIAMSPVAVLLLTCFIIALCVHVCLCCWEKKRAQAEPSYQLLSNPAGSRIAASSSAAP